MVSSSQSDSSNIDLYSPLPIGRQLFSQGMTILAFLLSGLALLPLFSVLLEIIRKGLPQLTWETLVSLPVGNAILGTLIMVGLAALVTIPLGVMTAIFLSEFSQGDSFIIHYVRSVIVPMTTGSQPIIRIISTVVVVVTQEFAAFVRFIVTVMSGVPSIVVGIFAWIVIVFTTKQFSALAGSFALGVIMLPIIVLSTEEALKLVPNTQRLASAALGAGHFQTTFRVVIRSALPGITTGILLAIARAAGEAAPLIFTALFSQNWPDESIESLFSPMASMSVLIYNYGATSPLPEDNQLAWTTSLILLGMILLINMVSRLVTRQR